MTDWKILDFPPALYQQLVALNMSPVVAQTYQDDANAINRLYGHRWIAPAVCDRARGKLVCAIEDHLSYLLREKAEAAS